MLTRAAERLQLLRFAAWLHPTTVYGLAWIHTRWFPTLPYPLAFVTARTWITLLPDYNTTACTFLPVLLRPTVYHLT